jgi:hypothetical protein
VEEFATGLVHALVSVAAEVIPLGLQQILQAGVLRERVAYLAEELAADNASAAPPSPTQSQHGSPSSDFAETAWKISFTCSQAAGLPETKSPSRLKPMEEIKFLLKTKPN